MRKLRIILNSPQDGLESSCPPSKYKLAKVNSSNFSIRRMSENSPMIPPPPSSKTKFTPISPYPGNNQKKIRLPLDLSKTMRLRDITNSSQFAYRADDNEKAQTEPYTPKSSTPPYTVQVVSKGPKKFERFCSNLPSVKKTIFTKLKFTEGKSLNNALDSSSPLPAAPSEKTVFRSNLLDADKENKNTIRTSVLRRLKTAQLTTINDLRTIQTRKITGLLSQQKTLLEKKIICVFDHDLGYLKKKLQETQNPSIQIEYHHLYPKSEEKGVQPVQSYLDFDKIYLFLNYSTCLKQKTIKASSQLSGHLGLKMSIIFCCLQNSPYPNFDYEDSSISKQDRILNEFRLHVQISEDISNGYQITQKNFENLQDFINQKLY